MKILLVLLLTASSALALRLPIGDAVKAARLEALSGRNVILSASFKTDYGEGKEAYVFDDGKELLCKVSVLRFGPCEERVAPKFQVLFKKASYPGKGRIFRLKTRKRLVSGRESAMPESIRHLFQSLGLL